VNKLPKLQFQRRKQFVNEHGHSALFSVLRGLAAVEVAAAHLRAEMYPGLRTIADPSLWFRGLAFMLGFSHHAVIIFFVLSGWLVGGRLLIRANQTDAFASYAIDRVSRLWTVLIPTFLLTLALGLATGSTIPQGIDFLASNEYSATSFAGNLVGLQTVLVPVFGRNYSLWSLANETWYYLLFALMVAFFVLRSKWARVACGAGFVLIAAALPAPLIGYFSIWLLGVAFSCIRIKCGAGIRFGGLVMLVAGAVYYRLTWNLDGYDFHTLGPDLLGSIIFLCLLSTLRSGAAPASTLARTIVRVGKLFADFSFSLYLLHVPLIRLIKYFAASRFGLHQLSPHAAVDAAIYFAMLATLLTTSYMWCRMFESQTYRVRKLLNRKLLKHPGQVPFAGSIRPDDCNYAAAETISSPADEQIAAQPPQGDETKS
jgi:peptidoglycan/LPS O-acetylase OafA/YrhL